MSFFLGIIIFKDYTISKRFHIENSKVVISFNNNRSFSLSLFNVGFRMNHINFCVLYMLYFSSLIFFPIIIFCHIFHKKAVWKSRMKTFERIQENRTHKKDIKEFQLKMESLEFSSECDTRSRRIKAHRNELYHLRRAWTTRKPWYGVKISFKKVSWKWLL